MAGVYFRDTLSRVETHLAESSARGEFRCKPALAATGCRNVQALAKKRRNGLANWTVEGDGRAKPVCKGLLQMADPKAASAVDKEIGARIRERREGVGYSQAYVADVIGISFQQLHKYETGDNRVAAAMLLRIAEALRTDAANFLPTTKRGATPKGPVDGAVGEDLLAVQLQHAFKRITSVRQRRLVLEMARSFSATAEEKPAKPKRDRKSKKR